MPTISKTTRVSIKEKPRCATSVPIAYIGITARPTGLPVRPQREHINLAMNTGLQILVRVAPRVVGQTVHIRTPIARLGWLGRTLVQRRQTLSRTGVTAVIQAVQLQGLGQRSNVLTSRDGTGL